MEIRILDQLSMEKDMGVGSFILWPIIPLIKDIGAKELRKAKELSVFRMEAFMKGILKMA